ncbi:chorismate mutase [Jiella sp. M17.18]|uniref:chorismate mutase n=1 Tax=Jiella sp. M17.18 TaxID=3234247 RepID=UPI0034DFDCFE
MNAPSKADPSRLLELRAQIDAIDESVHRLLMQRAAVIDELIKVKGTAKKGAAFRPGREADMMRRLAERHQGHLPLTAVEHLWREIISTFTALQAPFDVVVGAEQDQVAAMEVARFYFGFSVPMILCETPQDAVAAIEAGGDRLAVLPIGTLAHPWWQGLETAQVVARLPFFTVEDRQAATPALVVAPPLADPVPPEIALYAVDGLAQPPEARDGITVVAEARYGTDRFSAIVAGADRPEDIGLRLGSGLDIRPIGGYAAPFRPTP